MIAAYPLQWPDGWPRTPETTRKRAHFLTRVRSKYGDELTVADGVERVLLELSRFGLAREDIVISTNMLTRLDGLPRSDQKRPDDPGVAVYWQTRAGERRVMAIDQYLRVADNLAAVAATLDAMRAIERHGGARVLERAFTGFAALAAPRSAKHWREIIGVAPDVTDIAAVRAAFRRRAMEIHPDRPGGSHDKMAELNIALQSAEKELTR
ncbi:J domain-containing protein [Burkholderia gladioli]|uniref:J domain-containing protein n=1 Tax=Burkholderia gladioli TaxID=28095 RepID=UPI0016401B0C|nr:J domain-containing protein [Burkholderia gladioli]